MFIRIVIISSIFAVLRAWTCVCFCVCLCVIYMICYACVRECISVYICVYMGINVWACIQRSRLTSAVIFNHSCYLFIDSRSLTITQNSHYDCLLLAIFLYDPLPLPFEVEIPDFYNIHSGVIRMQLFVCMVF